MGIYKSERDKEKSLQLYDKQIKKLDSEYSDIYVDTSSDTMLTIKDSFDNVKTKVGMPTNVSKKLM